ncbi:TMEM175 family protein [Agromyces endophyticus]|uniref:TMEM175 family protein n=1 Tax=Agromyces sp. H17E-10 TaxID=2932244 RepID=UPI001FCFC1BF|nr:TMEM175 family protein [Agromyces sp. H17E-10]UOQ87656.1 TMEM175 family protein [Agromyces sp. H17E-10]
MSTSQPSAATAPDDGRGPYLAPAHRLKAFIDAVVAIAMTLLVLPLMESVTELGGEGGSVVGWFGEHGEQLMSFVLSFVLIATFWLTNHRVFAQLERTTGALLWLSVAWMFTIVWLPVPTAMLGAMEADDAQKVVYIGSLIVTSLASLAIRWYLLRHPELHETAPVRLRRGILADVISAALFALALVIAVAVPAVGYWAMFLLVLVSPLHALATRVGERRDRSARAGRDGANRQ